MVAQAVAELGRLDAVVNNAGIYRRSTLAETSLEDWHDTLETNLTAPWYVLKAALPHLGEGARIVNVSSVMGSLGSRHGAHYSASKAGVEALTRSLAKELAPRGILVNCVAPGAFETAMLGDDTKETRRWRLRDIPLKRVGRPEELAGVVSFLLGPDAAYITGQVIHVNGGLLM
jgi:3-oxoacyl-[acyl-carrier protein] reductase